MVLADIHMHPTSDRHEVQLTLEGSDEKLETPQRCQ